MRRAARQKAEQGIPKWTRAFGYLGDTRQPDPHIAPLVREAYAAIIAFSSLADVCRWRKRTDPETGDVTLEVERRPSMPYDRRAIGVISGAGTLRPGFVLGAIRSEKKRVPIGLIGKVFCKVDASQNPVQVGDLLTTSNVQGHAMKAVDARRAFGATIGKALSPLPSGRGLIPVFVCMQ